MSAQAKPGEAPDKVTIEIDGRRLEVARGTMIIQAADDAGIPIPRFCYHKKLSIAANCRMCLVDVEKAPKPMPACATPVMEGMRIYTRSRRALDAQRGVMEFLLINHPLDCPICDQGGECELQDLAMGYGRSVSRFTERKRVVADEDLGPLVATEMTRCIHCTRCVRFLAEIAGTCELGGMGRGEQLEIGTYIGRALESELSANIIDLCPVGALTNKPFRFRARAWEMIARPSLGYHDALGSNLWLHVRGRQVMRAVPRENEAINETWLSDRDRFSHLGLNAPDRLTQPMVRDQGRLRAAGWEEALARAAELVRAAGGSLGVIAHPSATCEEAFLLQALARGLGARDIDHRLRQQDFRDDVSLPAEPRVEATLRELQEAGAIFLIGTHPRHEAPLLGLRIRKAWQRGAAIFALRAVAEATHYEHREEILARPDRWPGSLAAVLAAAGAALPAEVSAAEKDARIQTIAETLAARGREAVIVLGQQAIAHRDASLLRELAFRLARHTGARLVEMPQGANARGAARFGLLPHRLPGGAAAPVPGRPLAAMLAAPPAALLWFAAEAPEDFTDGRGAVAALSQSRVVAFGAFLDPALAANAEVLLPIALVPENEGIYLNLEGREQRFAAAVPPPGEARPGWRVLRALGERLGLGGFDFVDLAALRERMDRALASAVPVAPAAFVAAASSPGDGGLQRVASVPIYRGDAVVRRAAALQATPLAPPPAVVLHPAEAMRLGLSGQSRVRVGVGAESVVLPLRIDRAVAEGSAWIPWMAETALLGWDQPVQLAEVGDDE